MRSAPQLDPLEADAVAAVLLIAPTDVETVSCGNTTVDAPAVRKPKVSTDDVALIAEPDVRSLSYATATEAVEATDADPITVIRADADTELETLAVAEASWTMPS